MTRFPMPVAMEGQDARALDEHCRNCRYYKAAFYRDGNEVFRLQNFRSPAKRDEAIMDWKRGKSMAYMAEHHLAAN